jgi:hypothetical protein
MYWTAGLEEALKLWVPRLGCGCLALVVFCLGLGAALWGWV